MKKILLLSRVNTTNLGDQLIGRSMISLFSEYGEITQTDICSSSKQNVLIYSEEQKSDELMHSNKTVGFHFHIFNTPFTRRLLRIYRNRSIFCVLKKQYDLIVIGGGELCSESFAFELSIWAILIRLLQNKPKVILFGVGVTNVDEKSRKRLNRIIRICDSIYVRDKASVLKMKDLYGLDAVEIPDVVFANDIQSKIFENKKRLALYGMTTSFRLAKHGYLFSEEKDYWFHSLEQIMMFYSKGYNVQLFYTTKDDYESCVRFKRFCNSEQGGNLEIANISSLDDLMRIVNESQIVCSPRMHACIIGLLSKCEVHPIVISEKMSQFEAKYNQITSRDLLLMRQQLLDTVYNIANF